MLWQIERYKPGCSESDEGTGIRNSKSGYEIEGACLIVAGDTTITVVGNLTADPELRFTPSGAAVANFTVASTPRIFDRQSS
ncbi:single-stranded DNA-binding protein, partial [Mycobacteroides abscessus]|uniref:single-stranded DNA-binding protein n=1 Tax=Mycobacteroides abscessus TaxID=36809 RepID=UPI000B167D25